MEGANGVVLLAVVLIVMAAIAICVAKTLRTRRLGRGLTTARAQESVGEPADEAAVEISPIAAPLPRPLRLAPLADQ